LANTIKNQRMGTIRKESQRTERWKQDRKKHPGRELQGGMAIREKRILAPMTELPRNEISGEKARVPGKKNGLTPGQEGDGGRGKWRREEKSARGPRKK